MILFASITFARDGDYFSATFASDCLTTTEALASLAAYIEASTAIGYSLCNAQLSIAPPRLVENNSIYCNN